MLLYCTAISPFMSSCLLCYKTMLKLMLKSKKSTTDFYHYLFVFLLSRKIRLILLVNLKCLVEVVLLFLSRYLKFYFFPWNWMMLFPFVIVVHILVLPPFSTVGLCSSSQSSLRSCNNSDILSIIFQGSFFVSVISLLNVFFNISSCNRFSSI